VLLSYRLPREPSTPRIAVWRRLRRLGVAQLADGVVGLPWDARTQDLAATREAEYRDIRDRAESATALSGPELIKAVRSLRRALREVQRRDYFPPPGRDLAKIAVETLAQAASADTDRVRLEA
jgi:hypothetical protein